MSRILAHALTASLAVATLVAGVAFAEAGPKGTAQLSLGARKVAPVPPTVPPTAGTILSNGTGRADLVILPWHNGTNGQPSTGFCGPWNGGNQKVYFYVKNVGSAVAPSTDVQVNFGGANFSEITVPSLAPNQSTLRSKTIPQSAWGPTQYHSSVQFLIASDHNDDVTEVSETNNYGQGTCTGPAT